MNRIKLFRKLVQNFRQMKKIITTVILATVIISCKNTGSTSSHVTDKLENKDQKVGYAYGMNVGNQVLMYSESMKDNPMDFNEVERGILDFINADDKTRDSYATGQNIGLSIINFIKTQKLEGVVDEKIVAQGIMDVLKKKDPLLFPQDSVNGFIQEYIQGNVLKIQKENLEKGAKFLEDKKKDSKVKSTESGLLYEVIKEGTGQSPNDNSMVKVHYVGKHIDGKTFDESKEEPVEFPLRGVIPGWQEGLKLMTPGSKFKFYIPADLAYGEYGSPDGGISPNEVLVFDVELVSVQDAPAGGQGQPQISPEQLEELQRQMQQQGN